VETERDKQLIIILSMIRDVVRDRGSMGQWDFISLSANKWELQALTVTTIGACPSICNAPLREVEAVV